MRKVTDCIGKIKKNFSYITSVLGEKGPSSPDEVHVGDGFVGRRCLLKALGREVKLSMALYSKLQMHA